MSPQPPKGYILIPEEKKDFVEPPKGYVLEPYKSPITKVSEKIAPAAGRIGVESLPFAGSFFGPGGTLIGTGISQAMKRAKPEIFGEQPQGVDAAADAAKELVMNNLVPGIIGKLGRLVTQVGMQGPGRVLAESFSGMPPVREGVANQLGENIKSQLTERYQPLGDYQPISIKPQTGGYQPINIEPQYAEYQGVSFKPRTAEVQPIKLGGKMLPTEASAPMKTIKEGSYESILGEIKQSDTPIGYKVDASGRPRKVLSGDYTVIPGEVKAAQDKLSKLVSGDRIDAAKTLDEITGPNASQYTDAMPTDTYQNVKKLLETMKGLQGKTNTDMVLNYSKHKLLWSGGGLLTGGLTGAALGYPIAGLALGGTPIVLNGILDRVMTNPETAKLVTLALTTPTKSPQATLINRALVEVLPRLLGDFATVPER